METKMHKYFLPLLLLLCFSSSVLAADKPIPPIPEKPSEQYTIVVFVADWCGACRYLEESLNSILVKIIITNQYRNDLYFVNVEKPENKEIVKSYLKLIGEPSGQIALPMMAIVYRPTSETKEGTVLIMHKGAMSAIALSIFLTNPVKYKKKPFKTPKPFVPYGWPGKFLRK